jgi:hypothetical protein
MAEDSSVTIFVVGDRLPWPDDAPAALQAGPLDQGVLYDSTARQPCSIRKVSALGATLRGDLANSPGDAGAIELGTGQRAAASVAWVRGDEAGICFDQPVDVVALINRKLVSQSVDRRAMPRVELRCPVHVKCAASLSPATLRNISARGLQVEGDALPGRGAYVSVHIEGLNVPAGEVVWRKDNLAGIELLEELSWTSIMPWIRDMVRKGIQ